MPALSHAEPVRPSWKNIPMQSIIARLSFASSAESFLLLSAWSPDDLAGWRKVIPLDGPIVLQHQP
eukprot:7557147-Prorocentrum_lima.AAC.1